MTKAVQVVDHMVSDEPKDSIHWPSPDAITFNTLLRGYAATRAVDQALRLVKKMEGMGVTPDEVSINTLAYVCVRAEDYDQAVKVVRGGGGTVEGWSSIIDGLVKRGDHQGVSSKDSS